MTCQSSGLVSSFYFLLTSNRVMCDMDSLILSSPCDDDNAFWEFGSYPEDSKNVSVSRVDVPSSTKSSLELKVSCLQYINGKQAVALCDSGSQLPVVSLQLVLLTTIN